MVQGKKAMSVYLWMMVYVGCWSDVCLKADDRGRVLFQNPGNLSKLPGLTPVLVRKRTANPIEVVAMPVTEMLQCDMPC